LIKGHLQLIQDRPDGQPIQIFQCIRCGSERACRPGWTTRCHVCHDKRTAGIWLERSEALYSDWLADLNQQEAHELETDVRKFANIGNEDLTALDIAYFVSAEILAIEMDRRAQTGWT
jgi:hypothetical protein